MFKVLALGLSATTSLVLVGVGGVAVGMAALKAKQMIARGGQAPQQPAQPQGPIGMGGSRNI